MQQHPVCSGVSDGGVQMTAIAFEQIPDVKDHPMYFAAPNEDLVLWREYVKGLHINRAAAISSSGEVGLFVMLPTVRKELVLIDHSARSLTVAMLKYLLIQELGPSACHKLLTTCDYATVRQSLLNVKGDLPAAARLVYDRMLNGALDDRQGREREPFANRYPYSSLAIPSVEPTIQRHWKLTPVRLIQRASVKLGKVKFVHGDMTKLEGQFDLLYLSNALEHAHVASSSNPKLIELESKVRPGGFVMVATRNPYAKPDSPYYVSSTKFLEERGWTVVEQRAGNRNNSSIIWLQTLLQVPAHREAV